MSPLVACRNLALIHPSEPIKHEAQAKEWIRARLESGYYLSFCVEELPSSEDGEIHKEKPEVIGMAGGTFLPEIGYMFRPAYWGRGYATEAVNGFMKFYWETFPEGHPTIADAEEKEYLKAMTGPPDEAPQSRASIAVLKKSGFEFWKEKDEYHELLEMKIRLLIWRRWGPGYGP